MLCCLENRTQRVTFEAIRKLHWSCLRIQCIAVENKRNKTCSPYTSLICVVCGSCEFSVLIRVMSGHAHVMFLLCWQVNER